MDILDHSAFFKMTMKYVIYKNEYKLNFLMAHLKVPFSAGFFDDANVADDHLLVDGFAHVVNGQGCHRGSCQSFHLHSGTRNTS